LRYYKQLDERQGRLYGGKNEMYTKGYNCVTFGAKKSVKRE
jgi:hypothetical protein